MLTPTEREAIMNEVDEGSFDLDTALDEIATQQRGEGVRRSLYGLALTLNKEGKAGAVDPAARQKAQLIQDNVDRQLLSIEKQMATFIANNSGTISSTLREETVLFTDDGSSGYSGSTINLSQAFTNFDFIRFEVKNGGSQPFETAVVLRKAKIQNSTTIMCHAGIPNDAQPTGSEVVGDQHSPFALQVLELRLVKVSDTRYTQYMTRLDWTGAANAASVGTTGSNIMDGSGITRITGIKYTPVSSTAKDTELTDMRVGYDGTQYASAGEAMRAQIQALQEQIRAISMPISVDSNGYLRFDGGETT